MTRLCVCWVIVALTGPPAARAQTQPLPAGPQVRGLGGAGGMYTPSVCPDDAKLMFVSCDMSGVYRSRDAGKTWTLIHYQQLASSRSCRPAFAAGAIYWVRDGLDLRVSRDRGATWASVAPARPWKTTITHLAALKGAPPAVLVGTGEGLFLTVDDGKTFRTVGEGACLALAAWDGGALAALRGPQGPCLLRTLDEGKTWATLPAPAQPDQPPLALSAGGAAQAVYVWAVVGGVGVLRSDDAGQTWKPCDGWRNQSDVVAPAADGRVAYVTADRKNLLATTDGGKTWTSVFRMFGSDSNVELSWVQTQLKWNYSISPLGVGIDPANGRTVLVSTQGDLYRSDDGGGSWRPIMNEAVSGGPAPRYRSNGLEVTSCWGYYFDPSDPSRHYIAYTDIGFGRSLDGGATWAWSARGSPWTNTFYVLEFDPYVKGRMYAACSNRHDIPHWTHLSPNSPAHAGGVCVSDDFGQTWRVLGTGLPKLPCTGLAIDRRSPRQGLVMYATFYEGGVYKSVDGGATWQKKSAGLGNPGNLHCAGVKVHPASGAVYCLITGSRSDRSFPVPGGLWRSTDGGERWQDLTAALKLAWPTNFALDDKNEATAYVTAGTVPGGRQGGLYRTDDAGASWKRLCKDEDFAAWSSPGYVQCMFVTPHPRERRLLYLGTVGHGLWVSRDAGATWEVFKDFPFRAAQSVAFDPADDSKLYVTTFGAGVWTLPHLPAAP